MTQKKKVLGAVERGVKIRVLLEGGGSAEHFYPITQFSGPGWDDALAKLFGEVNTATQSMMGGKNFIEFRYPNAVYRPGAVIGLQVEPVNVPAEAAQSVQAMGFLARDRT